MGGGSVGEKTASELYSQSKTYKKYINEDGTMTDLGKKKFGDFRGETPVDELVNSYESGDMDELFKDTAEYIQKNQNLSISDSLVEVERMLVDRSNTYLVNRMIGQVKKENKNKELALITAVSAGMAIVTEILSDRL